MVRSKKTIPDSVARIVNDNSSQNFFCRVLNYYVGCFRKYACLGGRASRMEFFSFFIINFLIGSVLSYLGGMSLHFWGLSILYSIVAFTPFCAVLTRRVHDINHSGWTLLFSIISIFISIIGASEFVMMSDSSFFVYVCLAIIFLVFAYLVFLLFKRGNKLPNKYDTTPSHPYRDGVILVLFICLYYGLGFYVLLSSNQNKLQAGFALQDFLGTDDELDNTVTVIEEADDETNASISESISEGNEIKKDIVKDKLNSDSAIVDSKKNGGDLVDEVK